MLVTCLFPGWEPQLYVAVCALGAMAHRLVSDVALNSARLPFARAGSLEPRSSPSCRFRCLGGCRQWLCMAETFVCWVHDEGRDEVLAGFCHQHENEPREMQMDGSESPNSPKDHPHPSSASTPDAQVLPPGRGAGDALTFFCGSHAKRFPGSQLGLEGSPERG